MCVPCYNKLRLISKVNHMTRLIERLAIEDLELVILLAERLCETGEAMRVVRGAGGEVIGTVRKDGG